MLESEFWDHLRQALNRIPEIPAGYCDWIEPKKYTLNGESLCVVARIGFVVGRDSTQWQLIFEAKCTALSVDSIDWSALPTFTEKLRTMITVDSLRNRIDADLLTTDH